MFIKKEWTVHVCWFLRRGGNRSTWRKTFQIMQRRVLTTISYPRNVVDARIQTWPTLVGYECSDLCSRQPAPPNHFSRSLPCYRITLYHMAESTSGQDEVKPAFWLATRSCPLRIPCFGPICLVNNTYVCIKVSSWNLILQKRNVLYIGLLVTVTGLKWCKEDQTQVFQL